MAQWRVSTAEKKSVEEREIWIHPKKGTIERRSGFFWASYMVTTDDDKPPKFELRKIPGGDEILDSIDLNDCGYDTELISLDDGLYLEYKWPEKMSEAEKIKMENAWADDMYDGWENLGWILDDTQVWVWGALDIEPA